MGSAIRDRRSSEYATGFEDRFGPAGIHTSQTLRPTGSSNAVRPSPRTAGFASNRLARRGRVLAACSKSERAPVADTLPMVTNIGQQSPQTKSGQFHMIFNLTSPAFAQNGPIPAKYTCEGADISPPLEWSGASGDTKSYALIVDDPDAPDPAKPQRVYVHWVVYNIPASTTKLPGERGERRTTQWSCAGKQRLGQADLWWALSADRASSLLLQALRARHRAEGIEQSQQGAAREGNAGPYSRQRPVNRDVPEAKEVAGAQRAAQPLSAPASGARFGKPVRSHSPNPRIYPWRSI